MGTGALSQFVKNRRLKKICRKGLPPFKSRKENAYRIPHTRPFGKLRDRRVWEKKYKTIQKIIMLLIDGLFFDLSRVVQRCPHATLLTCNIGAGGLPGLQPLANNNFLWLD